MSVIVAELAAKLGLKVDKKSWSVGNDVIAGLGKALAVFVGYKVVSGIADMVGSVVELGSSLNDTATKTGLSVEALQEYGYIAKLNGSSSEEFSGSVTKLARSLDEAKKSSSPAAEAFRRLGIQVGSNAFKKLTLDEKIELLAKKLNGVKDPGTRAALAMQIFGRSAAGLLPTFKDVAENGAALRQEFRDIGGELTTGDASKLDNLGDDLDRVKTAWQGIKNQVVIALVPVLQKMATGLLSWVKANRELLASKLQSFVGGLAAVLQFLASAVAFVVEHWQIFAALLAGAGVVTGVIRVIKLFQWLGLASTQAAAKMLLAWAAAALPFVLIAAFVALVLLALTKYRKQVGQIISWIKDKFSALGSWIASLPGKAVNALSGLASAIADKFKEAWESVKQGARDTWDYIKSLPGKALDVVFGSATGDTDIVQRTLAKKKADYEASQARRYGTPDRPVGTIPGGGNVTNTYGDINVTSNATDPTAVGVEVRKAVRDEWDANMRHAHAGTGAE